MSKALEKPIGSILILVILSLHLFFFRLGDMALSDPDETFYAQTAKEMMRRGEWITPYLYGRPQFEKPIFFYWLVEASFKLFGVNEFAARLPSAAFGLLGVIFMYLLGTILFNRRVGLFSAIILAANAEYIVLSRACVTDMALTTFMLLGLAFFFYGQKSDKDIFYLLSSAAFALATLTKGPIGVILPAFIIVAYLAITRNMRIFKNSKLLFSLVVIFAMVSLPWYFSVLRLHGKEFIDEFLGFHNITRFLEAEHELGSQFYYNIPVVFIGFFPWSAFLPLGFWHLFKKSFRSGPEYRDEKNHSIFILLWFFVIFIFFSISSTKLVTYIFPSFISLALIVGIFWDDFLRKAAPPKTIKHMWISYYLLIVIIAVMAVTAIAYVRLEYPSMLDGVLVSVVFFVFGAFLSMTAFINKNFLTAFFFIVYSVVIFLYPVNELIIPAVEPYETTRDISRRLLKLMKPDEKMGSESHYLAGLAFYTDKTPVDLDKHHILVKFLDSKERVWCVLKEKNHIQLYTLDAKPLYRKASYMVYRFDKKCIVTNKIPDDGVYLVKRERLK